MLDPVLVAKFATMELRARYVVEGALAGRHRGLRQGSATEFAGHRAYSPGDEWRRVDWKVYAKTDRWVVREQQEETELRAALLLDSSNSMAFGVPGRLPKFRYASILAAALGYLLVNRSESVGLGFFAEKLRDFVPPRGGTEQLARLLSSLDDASCAGRTDFAAALTEAGQRLPKRSLVVLVSDFLGPPETLLPALRTLLARRHEVVALQVLDPGEIDLPAEGEILFEDLETGETLRANADEIRADYRRGMEERLRRAARAFESIGADHFMFTTDMPLDAALAGFLARREARRRG